LKSHSSDNALISKVGIALVLGVIVEVEAELVGAKKVSIVGVVLVKLAVEKGVTESEGGHRELVEERGVDVRVVIGCESGGREDLVVAYVYYNHAFLHQLL